MKSARMFQAQQAVQLIKVRSFSTTSIIVVVAAIVVVVVVLYAVLSSFMQKKL